MTPEQIIKNELRRLRSLQTDLCENTASIIQEDDDLFSTRQILTRMLEIDVEIAALENVLERIEKETP